MAFHRIFEGSAPHITFTATWQQIPFGHLVPGSTVLIDYDPRRLPNERSNYNGVPTWSITAFYQFAPKGAVAGKQLEIRTGDLVERYSPDPMEATMMSTSIEIPEDAAELILWFLNTGRSGQQFWDSAYGANYVFRFTSIDIEGEHARIVSDPETPYSAFQVELTARPEIDSVSVAFEVTNSPAGRPFRGSVPLHPGELANGRRNWSAFGISVPRGANVRFSFCYTVEGRTFVDDNDARGFFAPKPLPTNNPEAFLAALARRQRP